MKRPDIRADLRNRDPHASWLEVYEQCESEAYRP